MPALRTIESKPYISPLLVFSMIMFFACLGDSIMSYVSPVYIEENVHSPFLMGLILSFSSLVGVVFDFYISEKQWHKTYRFFIKTTVLLAILFPITFILLPAHVFTFLTGMFLWGAYYEYRGFSNYNFIHHFLSKDKHSLGWGIILSSMSFAYLLGSTISSNIVDLGFKYAFSIALIPFVLAFVMYKIFSYMYAAHIMSTKKHVIEVKKGLRIEFKILRSLWHRIWPLTTFSFMIMFIDACFWTVGVLLTENLKDTSKVGSLLLVAYMFPPVFTGLLASKFNTRLGKKRTSFIAGLISAVFLVAVGFVQSVPLLIVCIALMSVFLNIGHVLHSAAVEDYVARLGNFGNDIVTTEQLAGSTAYIIGPIVLGFLAETIGYQQTFAVAGVLMALTAVVCLVVVPRKLKMPQVELKQDISS
jgi:MFS family permease